MIRSRFVLGLPLIAGLSCGPAPRAASLSVSAPPVPSVLAPVAIPSASPSVATPLHPAERVRDAAMSSSQALDHVTSLVDEVGQRISGSPQSKRAVTWALTRMKSVGLTNVRAEALKEPSWVRLEEKVEILTPTPHVLSAVALGLSVSSGPKGVEGEIVEVGSLEALEKVPDERVKGKIVFFNKPMQRTKDATGYGKAVDVRGRGASAAAKKGAVAVLVRSIGTDADRHGHTGAMRYLPDVKKIPAAALSIPDAELVHRLAAKGAVRVRVIVRTEDRGEVDGANVVGELVGTDKKDEIVLLGAHLDSWDVGQGALDDGAGCAIVLEAARQIAILGVAPRRTVRVVLFANEEYGLAGAKAYAKDHASEIARHVVAVEADLGDGRVFEARVLAAPDRRPVFERAAKMLGPIGVAISMEPAHEGADLIPLRALGVPVLDLRQDATRYFDVHHTENDVLEKIVKADLEQAAATYASIALALALDDADLGRLPEALRGDAK